ncbi:MAG: trypsin-like peptidase domain-containing protein [Planctomycetes bacterium]|nr:trypsin-like peptidase domain-containing protein [Planctomycetota bacterium]
MTTLPRTLLLLGLLSALAAGQTLRGVQAEFAAIGDRVIPATVFVRAAGVDTRQGGGSTGVVIHESGYVLSDADSTLTSVEPGPDGNPVKRHGTDAIVRLPAPDHREFAAILVRRDEETDSSLLRITDKVGGRLPFVSLGSSDELHVGDFSIVVGNTFGSGLEGEPSLTMGSVSALILRRAGGGGRFERIYTSAAVNPGCNGGPCLDSEGRLVGVVSTWDLSPTSPFRALGIVTPLDRIRERYRDVPDFEKIFPDPKQMKPRSAEAAILERAFGIVARGACPAIVSLTVSREGAKGVMQIRNPMRARDPSLPPTMDIPLYPGPYSGVVLSADGWIATCTANLWEFDTIKSVTAHLVDGRDLPARIVARDRYRMIGLLKVEATDLVPLPSATDADLTVGRFALALGNPFGPERQEAPLFTRGIISNLHRINRDFDAIQTDAGMNDAMIGGALVSLDGKLLGINLAYNPETFGRNSGIGFAIPTPALAPVLPQLREGKNVEPGWMGIQQPTMNEEGELVFPVVSPDGPAAKAGLRNGDRLVEVDGRKSSSFKDPVDFIEYVRGKGPGAELKLEVRRGTESLSIVVILGSRPGD